MLENIFSRKGLVNALGSFGTTDNIYRYTYTLPAGVVQFAGEGESAAKSIQHQYCILIGINQDESIAKQIKKKIDPLLLPVAFADSM